MRRAVIFIRSRTPSGICASSSSTTSGSTGSTSSSSMDGGIRLLPVAARARYEDEAGVADQWSRCTVTTALQHRTGEMLTGREYGCGGRGSARRSLNRTDPSEPRNSVVGVVNGDGVGESCGRGPDVLSVGAFWEALGVEQNRSSDSCTGKFGTRCVGVGVCHCMGVASGVEQMSRLCIGLRVGLRC